MKLEDENQFLMIHFLDKLVPFFGGHSFILLGNLHMNSVSFQSKNLPPTNQARIQRDGGDIYLLHRLFAA